MKHLVAIKLHQFTNVEGSSDSEVCFDNAEYGFHKK